MDNFSTMDNQKLWFKFLDTVRPQISSANFRTFFAKTKVESISDGKIILATPSAFVKETLNQRHLPLIEKTLEDLLGKKIGIEFIVKNNHQTPPEDSGEDIFQPISVYTTSYINPKYTLENFVVGPSNNVAYAAAQAVTQNPGFSYNPLFIYGGTGVGKTHLMIGVGNTLMKKGGKTKIIYCSSEKFMNDYVEAIQTRRMTDLRKKYRSADVLLVDDIQFFSGREGTQEEFFHTFNELIGKNSQIVLTSDRIPLEIAKLEDRLKSRFAGGLMVDIQPPDFDTRVAIVRAKCLEQGNILPEETLALLASSFDTNIRELEGKLAGILQILKTKGLPPTNENISKFLKKAHQPILSIDPTTVLTTVCNYFNLQKKELVGSKRQKALVLPRHIIMFLLSEELKITVEKIGQILGGRDHTTVMHGRDKIKNLINSNREIQKILIEIKSRLYPHN